MIGILLILGNRINSGIAVDPDHLCQVVAFFREYADEVHHAKEEDLLFEIMEAADIAAAHDLIDSLRAEHTLARMFLDSLDDAIADYSDDAATGSQFKESADGYAELLLHHICREDDIFYPLADKSLSEEQKRQLAEASDKTLSDPDKAKKSEHHLTVLTKLQKAYPLLPSSAIGQMIYPQQTV